MRKPTVKARTLPDHMPVVAARIAGGDCSPVYQEREITAAVPLCGDDGLLNPAAVGWSRTPLVSANLRGHWPRKKRWNFWNWISPDFVFSVTLADVDLASLCAVAFVDLRSGRRLDGMDVRRPGFAVFPEQVEHSLRWNSGKMSYTLADEGGDIGVEFSCANVQGVPVRADFVIHRPRGHESLNVVVPWARARFQLNSNHNTLPCSGSVTVGERRYDMHPEHCHGVQDFGRGLWPYRSLR
jgi:hypothetical protein